MYSQKKKVCQSSLAKTRTQNFICISKIVIDMKTNGIRMSEDRRKAENAASCLTEIDSLK